MRKKRLKPVSNYPYKKQPKPPEKLYGYVIDVDDLVTMQDETKTEDIDYIEVRDERKLLN